MSKNRTASCRDFLNSQEFLDYIRSLLACYGRGDQFLNWWIAEEVSSYGTSTPDFWDGHVFSTNIAWKQWTSAFSCLHLLACRISIPKASPQDSSSFFLRSYQFSFPKHKFKAGTTCKDLLQYFQPWGIATSGVKSSP